METNVSSESPAAFEYVGQDPVLWSKPTQLNADGTIAIKGEAAEQLKALIREALQEYGLGDWVRNNV